MVYSLLIKLARANLEQLKFEWVSCELRHQYLGPEVLLQVPVSI